MKNRKYIILLSSILFVVLTILVKFDYVSSFDTFVYNVVAYDMNNVSNNLYKIITFFGSTLFMIVFCFIVLLFFIMKKENKKGYLVGVTLIISTIFNNFIKLLIRRERPEVLALVIEKSFSYPSGHTMASVSMYGILLYILLTSDKSKKTKVVGCFILGSLPVLVGISRIYLGVHFASDVIGAFLVSIILLLIITYYVDKNKSL